MIISSYDAYVLIDTGATYAYIFQDFLSLCGLILEFMKDNVKCVNIPLGSYVN